MSETIPEEYTSSAHYGLSLAMKRVSEHKGVPEFFRSGLNNCMSILIICPVAHLIF